VLYHRDNIAIEASGLAARGVYIGTSSWKYPGWRGQLYTDDRYIFRGNYSQSRFDRLCLSEYAEVFKTVCVDAAYYRFPDARFMESTFDETPRDFLFGLKVTDRITVKRFPNFPRFGDEAGAPNPDFLNSDLFSTDFLGPLQGGAGRIGILIFEFSKFHVEDYSAGREFIEDLDKFLGSLPPGYPYGVEIRNRNFLRPEYFGTLTKHGVTHVYNSWQDMPSVSEQLALPGSRTSPCLTAARMLLRPGRRYEDAVKLFSPYNETRDPYPEGQHAAATLVREVVQSGGKTRGFVFVNNRFEGNALHTIARILERAKTPA
jgi:uncharacterized protein YecE (DUF72 family)